jgi:hypothetical protein
MYKIRTSTYILTKILGPLNYQLEKMWPIDTESIVEQNIPTPAIYLSRTALSFLVITIAILVPSFSKVVGILGSCFSFFGNLNFNIQVVIIFPVACDLRLKWTEKSLVNKVSLYFLSLQALSIFLLFSSLLISSFATICVIIS